MQRWGSAGEKRRGIFWRPNAAKGTAATAAASKHAAFEVRGWALSVTCAALFAGAVRAAVSHRLEGKQRDSCILLPASPLFLTSSPSTFNLHFYLTLLLGGGSTGPEIHVQTGLELKKEDRGLTSRKQK